MESEIKLRLPDRSRAEQIQDDDWFDEFAPHDPAVYTMHTRYLDTAGRKLRSAGVMFRVRQEGDRQVATCKIGPASGDDGFYQHMEWNLTIEPELETRIEEEGLPDVFMDLADGDGDDELFAALRPIRNEPLVTVVEAQFERTAFDAFFGESLLEIVFDIGQFVIDGRDSSVISEVEIELKEGNVTDLLEFGRLFQDYYRLEPETASKYERALALL